MLAARTPGPALVLTDGVFSMDGDLAPLPAIAAACATATALCSPWTMRTGSACSALAAADHWSTSGSPRARCRRSSARSARPLEASAPSSRATPELIETLVQRARTYIYTTALPVAVAAATRAALAVSIAEAWRRTRVAALTRRFRLLAAEAGLPLADSTTPIQPIPIGDPDAAVAASARLLERGFFVAAIRPPTVPAGGSRLRVALSASHRDGDVEGLVAALTECGLRP